jgi:hypothetical protein
MVVKGTKPALEMAAGALFRAASRIFCCDPQQPARPFAFAVVRTSDWAWKAGEWAFRSVFKRNDPYGEAEKQQEKCTYPIRIERHDITPSRSRRKNGMKFKLRRVPNFGRSAAAQ